MRRKELREAKGFVHSHPTRVQADETTGYFSKMQYTRTNCQREEAPGHQGKSQDCSTEHILLRLRDCR